MNQNVGVDAQSINPSKRLSWIKKLGWPALIFFTVKGMLYLIIPALAVRSCAG